MTLRHHLLAGALLTLVGLCGTPALAAKSPPRSREDSANKARMACLTGDVQTGMAILSELFIATKDPLWIYNQARCLQQNGRYDEAVTRFEEYLRLTKGSTGNDRVAAEEHLADCQAKLAKTTVSAPPPPTPAVEALPLPPPEPAVGMDEVKPTETTESGGRVLRIAGITAGAVGVAALGGGLAFNLLANQTAKDLNAKGGYDRDKASTRSTYATLTWVGYGVGGACLVGGALLYYLGSRGADSSAVAFTPTLAPGQAGMSLQGAF